MKHLIGRVVAKVFFNQASKRCVHQKPTLVQIRQALHAAVSDCDDVRGKRVGYKIDQAKTASELWALRSDLHQCVAQHYSERVAAARINDLMELFEGWIPDSQLMRIQPGFRTSEK